MERLSPRSGPPADRTIRQPTYPCLTTIQRVRRGVPAGSILAPNGGVCEIRGGPAGVRSALGLAHHRVHDSRHYYAIRAIPAGTPYELVARPAHADIAMVAKMYGRFEAAIR